jgi:hypothetical protein
MNYEEITRPIVEDSLNNIPTKLQKSLVKFSKNNINEFLVKAVVVGVQYFIVITNLITQNPEKYNEEMTNDVVSIFFWLIKLCCCTCKLYPPQNFKLVLYNITSRTDNFFKASPIAYADSDQVESLLIIIQIMIDKNIIFNNKEYGIYISHVLYFVDLRINVDIKENNRFACILKYIWKQIALIDFKQIDMSKLIDIMKRSNFSLAKLEIAHLVLPDILKKSIVHSRFNENDLAEFMTLITVSRNYRLSTFYDMIKLSYLEIFKEKGQFLKKCLNLQKVPMQLIFPANNPIENAIKYVKECPICFDDLKKSNACLLSCVSPSADNTWNTCPHMICSSCWQILSTRLCPLCRRACNRVEP